MFIDYLYLYLCLWSYPWYRLILDDFNMLSTTSVRRV